MTPFLPLAAPAVTRPALRYHGGKWRLATWVIGHFPPHRTYVERFGGAASVLLRKAPVYAEIYNDLDADVVNLFSVLREEAASRRLAELCRLTPFARAEFELAYLPTEEAVERARRLLVRSFMGHGSSGLRKLRTAFRAGVFRSHTTPAQDWWGWPNVIEAIRLRLRGVVVECRPAEQLIARYDAPETLFYIDPPYPFGARSQKRLGNDLYHGYRHELSDADHAALLAQLRELSGMVVLSSYPNGAYAAALPGWSLRKRRARADGARMRVEALYLNPAAVKALARYRRREGAAA